MKNRKDETPAGWDRRTFNKMLAAGLGGLALGGAARGDGPRTAAFAPFLCTPNYKTATIYPNRGGFGGKWPEKMDVVVIGAGLSGLIAARQLRRAGMSVLVLEGNCRISGRMVGQETSETKVKGYLDLGGQWVGQTQNEMQNLAAELDIRLFESWETGRAIQLYDEKRTLWNGDVAHLLEGRCQPPSLNGMTCADSPIPICSSNAEEERIWGALLAISQTVPPDRPWDTPMPADPEKNYDRITFQKWLGSMNAKNYTEWLPSFQARIGGSGGFEPSQVSLLHMAWTQRVGPQSETPEEWLMCGGAGQIPARLADELTRNNVFILMNAPVTKIDYDTQGQVIVTAAPDPDLSPQSVVTVMARAVIVAIPPSLRGKITFYPRLPDAYRGFIDGSPMGSMSKVHAVYETAWWRSADVCLSGSAAGNLRPMPATPSETCKFFNTANDRTLSVCEFVADSSPPGGAPGILTSFISSDRNRQLTSCIEDEATQQASVRARVLDDFRLYFNNDDRIKTQLKEFVFFDWNAQPLTGGAFTTHLGPQIWTKFGKQGWREPVGDVFWAGTETADRWPGYFDGAIRAGKAAAMQVLEHLCWSKNVP